MSHSLSRRPDATLVGALRDQVAAAADGVVLASAVAGGELDIDVAQVQMAELEHRGDRHRSASVTRLANAFANPIDREDLFRLSRSIDDVLDNLRDFVREVALFQVTPSPGTLTVLEAIGAALQDLDLAIGRIATDPLRIRSATLAARKNDVRRRYQEALAQVLSGEPDATSLKNRELLRRLDVVGLRLAEAADALADGAMKRSH